MGRRKKYIEPEVVDTTDPKYLISKMSESSSLEELSTNLGNLISSIVTKEDAKSNEN